VVLVGGSTRTPLIKRMLEQRLGQPVHAEVNPDLCVAMGAAIQAGIISGQDVGAVLVDVTPHTLGIKCLDLSSGFPNEFKFGRIIHRNTALPAVESEVFYTSHDHQREVEIDVYQGESDDVRRNTRIGRFLVSGLAPVPAGNQILVQFDLNLDGILRVTARERATGLAKEVVIENALSRSTSEREAARARLERLWLEDTLPLSGLADDAAEDDGIEEESAETPAFEAPELAPGPREGQREAVQARALLEKAERLLTQVAPEDKPDVERHMERVRTALTDRRWDELQKASDDLADVLFYLEG